MLSFIGLSLLLLAGHVLRMNIRLLRRLFLPSSVIAGILGLTVLQSMQFLDGGIPEAWTAGWSRLPGLLINIVFACLFLGITLPKVSTLWKHAGSQVIYGQIVAWGQYVVGIGLVLFVLAPMFDLPDMFAGILPVGFEGGHGTAAGLQPTFERLGWPAGADFALTSATGGIVSAIIFGMILINWAVRKGYTHKELEPENVEEDDTISVIPIGERPSAGRLTVKSDAIETFSLHLAIVSVALLIGYMIKEGLVFIEGLIPALARHGFFESFPLFPLCMIGGLIVQIFEEKFDKRKLIDIGLTRRIQNTALDYLIVAAISTIRLNVILAGLVPLLILIVAGIVWNVFCVTVLARRILPDAWFERAIAEMGQSMGVTATGLLLLRVVDPDYETPAADAFAYKQLVHEPFMGGGLWTGMAIPLLAVWGGMPVFLIACGMITLWLAVAFLPKVLGR